MSAESDFAEIVDLSSIRVEGETAKTRAQYESRYGDKPGKGVYSRHDWARISYVLHCLEKGGAVLDVGVGSGQLINTLAASGEFERVVGIDVTTHTKFIRLSDSYELQRMNVADLSFDDDSFDVVVCMEVLEHVDRETFLAGLDELRRVCRTQLIMTVPFEEPLPLPVYHKQRFDKADVETLWPLADKRLLQRPRVSWLLLEESSPGR